MRVCREGVRAGRKVPVGRGMRECSEEGACVRDKCTCKDEGACGGEVCVRVCREGVRAGRKVLCGREVCVRVCVGWAWHS